MPYFNFDKEPKRWNNKCPKCGAEIRWYMNNCQEGSRSQVYCANNIRASVANVFSLRDLEFCFWEGTVVRQKDGGIRFSNKDGEWLREYLK